MTNKMVQIITTTKFKVTAYLTFKEAFDSFTHFVLTVIFVLFCSVQIITKYKYLHSLQKQPLEDAVRSSVYL